MITIAFFKRLLLTVKGGSFQPRQAKVNLILLEIATKQTDLLRQKNNPLIRVY